ncbi:V4R domain-containing protein [archaeon]
MGVKLDLKKLSKVPLLKKVGKLDLLEARLGDVVIHLFSTGEMRAFSPGQKLDKLQPALLASSVKILEILSGVKAAGYAIDEQVVLSSGHEMPFKYLTPEGVRPSFKGVSIDLLHEVTYAPYGVAQQFQLERNAVQAGENAGRRIAKASTPKDVNDLNTALVSFMADAGVGVASFKEEKVEKSTYPAQVLTLEESAFAAGMPAINATYCHFVRGLLRGAYVVFYELENIEVKEENCWGLGHDFCQFRAVVFAK